MLYKFMAKIILDLYPTREKILKNNLGNVETHLISVI
jgi:hypothetical protein